jgi:hypothetical protein
MKICKSCFYPDTKPDLVFNNNGICSACIAFEQRKKINWKKRENEFRDIVAKIKKTKKYGHNCIVPVSGGKDSTWQVIKVLEYGLKPLCVNSRCCDLSDIGRKNLDNIRNLGVDLIEICPNPLVRKKLNKIGLLEVGDISWPEHIGIFSVPAQIALNFKINYIFWGENSQNEYGGPISKINNTVLDRSWLEEFGGLLGLRLSDIKDYYDINAEDLEIYKYPEKIDIEKSNITGLFLGYFFEWNGNKNAEIAIKNGFKVFNKKVEGTPVNYENLDNYQTGIHDYFKYIKYGFGRTTDIINNLYRRKLISKDEAIKKIRKNDGQFPHTYLGKNLKIILKKIDVSFDEFIQSCNNFTNSEIFQFNNDGKPVRDKNFNLLKKNDPFD